MHGDAVSWCSYNALCIIGIFMLTNKWIAINELVQVIVAS